MKVDFFIVGAPKCGTTSLISYLSEHPDIGISKIKEPFFFNTKTPSFQGVKTWKQYMSLYRGMEHCALRGEGTTWYLFSDEAVDNILKHNPDAKFVVCLRNPAEAVIAWHNQVLLVGAESETNFQTAWKLQEQRISDDYPVPVYGDIDMLSYSKAYKLGDQLQSIMSKVKRMNLHIVFMDDLKANPRKVYLDLLEFLDVNDDGRKEFPIAYARAATKSNFMRWIVKRFSYYQRIYLTRILHTFRIDIHKLYLKLNTRKSSGGSALKIDPSFRDELRAHFFDQVEKIEALTGRDLDSWKCGPIKDTSSAE